MLSFSVFYTIIDHWGHFGMIFAVDVVFWQKNRISRLLIEVCRMLCYDYE